jgi:nitrogen fixation protein FixH
MFIAKADPAFAVEPDYYARAVAWDEHMAQGRRNAALGWRASATLTLAASPAQGRVTVNLSDADGRPLDEAQVTVEAMHNARASRRHHVALRTTGNGTYDGVLAAERPGAWELRLTAVRDSARFTETIRLDVPR